jgi:GAF domain-containing protein
VVTDHVLTEVLSTFAETVADDFTTAEVLRQLGQGAVRVLGVDGAGIMVPHGTGLLRFAFATGPAEQAVTALERLQERLQTGPCGDSHQSHAAIDIADLAAEGFWPAFQQQAVDVGLRAVTALPLLARGRSWGVLDLYRASRAG